MSLSKYYKNSPAFQAEELVKKVDRQQGGWIPAPAKPTTPFTSQKLSRDMPPTQGAMGKPLPPLPPTGTASQQPAPPPSQEVAPPSPAPAVDPNIYIERKEAEQIAEDAYRQGFDEGLARAESEFGTAANSLLLACQQLDTLRETLIANSGREMLDFALAVAERILRLSLREQDQTLIATIEEALHMAVKSEEYTLHINPDDYEILNAKAVDIVGGISGLNNIVIKQDKSIEKGGVFIESENCTIDATIASQLELIREEIKKRL